MSSRLTFGTIKRVGAILIAIAIVLAAGIVVGQAPTIFGVDENPEASIEFEDQQRDGESVVISEVSLTEGGFVVITDGDKEPLAVSDYLESGTHENVTVELDEDSDSELVGRLTATVHRDTTGDESYAYQESDGEEDHPYLRNGFPVSDTATVTSEGDDPLSGSFLVDSISAPESATTNETIEVVAEITNPTELTTQQNVEVRIDGTVFESQALELEGEETREVTFEVDTSGAPPGERTIGVYTDGDGALRTIDLEFHTEPGVEAVDASDGDVTFDVAIPAEGFVAVEDANGTTLATSDQLDPGEHGNVTVELGENASVEDDDELTAVLYEGDPAEPEAATPIEDEDSGERIETTFTLADATAEADGDEDSNDSDGE